MYITHIPLNVYRQDSKKLIASRQVAHATVLQSFAPSQETINDKGRVLWRLDLNGRAASLVIVSPSKPSVSHILENCGWDSAPEEIQQVSYIPLLNSLQIGGKYSFTMVVNPVTSVTGSSRKIPVEAERLEKWAFDKLSLCGMVSEKIEIKEYETGSFRRGNSFITLATTRITGIITITQPETAKKALVFGIGRAKGYGCGLLTLDEQII